jgi:ligand-binding SRPBCC domain-containing protein
MAHLERSVEIVAPVEEVFQFCVCPEGFQKHFPCPVVWDEKPAHFSPGARVTFRFRMWGLWFRWQAQVVAWEPNRLFVDEMRAGPYRSFRHTHRFEPTEGGTRYTDAVEFDTGWGSWINHSLGLWLLRSVFRKRQTRLKAALEQARRTTTPSGAE